MNRTGAIIAAVAGCVSICSFIISEKRHSAEKKNEDAHVECITNAISELIDVAKDASFNESDCIHIQEKNATPINSGQIRQQMWSTAVHIAGVKNKISFVVTNGNNEIPHKIGGTRSNKIVPVPENCQLTVYLSGVKNRILIDERLRSHVSVSGAGAGGSVEWVRYGQ